MKPRQLLGSHICRSPWQLCKLHPLMKSMNTVESRGGPRVGLVLSKHWMFLSWPSRTTSRNICFPKKRKDKSAQNALAWVWNWIHITAVKGKRPIPNHALEIGNCHKEAVGQWRSIVVITPTTDILLRAQADRKTHQTTPYVLQYRRHTHRSESISSTDAPMNNDCIIHCDAEWSDTYTHPNPVTTP